MLLFLNDFIFSLYYMSREIHAVCITIQPFITPRYSSLSVAFFIVVFFKSLLRPFWQGLLEFICRILDAKPAVLCDMHGHSRRFNAFVYGCKGSQSWCPDDWSQKDAQGDHPTMKKLKDENGDDDDTTSLPVIPVIGS
jgi:hypothetical protein